MIWTGVQPATCSTWSRWSRWSRCVHGGTCSSGDDSDAPVAVPGDHHAAPVHQVGGRLTLVRPTRPLPSRFRWSTLPPPAMQHPAAPHSDQQRLLAAMQPVLDQQARALAAMQPVLAQQARALAAMQPVLDRQAQAVAGLQPTLDLYRQVAAITRARIAAVRRTSSPRPARRAPSRRASGGRRPSRRGAVASPSGSSGSHALGGRA